MNLRQLRYFVAIVEHGSFASAARVLFVAQPSLSQHVKNLEEELGVELLRRTARGVEATAEGRVLLGHAQSILDQVEVARNAVENAGQEVSGNVRLGVPPTVSELVTVPLIVRLRRDAPRVSLRVVEGMSGYVLNWLQEGRVDIAVLYDVQDTPGVTTTELCREDLYLIGPPNAVLEGDTVDFVELESAKLILPGEHHGLRVLLEEVSRTEGVDLNVQVEVDALGQMRALVAAGIGYTVLPLWAVAKEAARNELSARRIINPVVQRKMSIAYPSNRALSSAARAVVALLKERLAEPR